jgi:hypothetical protein
MMSSGLIPHGEQAVALTLMSKWSIPRSLAKIVGTLAARSVTTTALTGLQPGIEAMHLVVTVVVMPGTFPCAF